MAIIISTVLHAYAGGRNGSGAISIPGLKAGDILMFVQYGYGSPPAVVIPANGSTNWETIVSVDDELQQTNAGDLSDTGTYKFVFFRGS